MKIWQNRKVGHKWKLDKIENQTNIKKLEIEKLDKTKNWTWIKIKNGTKWKSSTELNGIQKVENWTKLD